MKKEIYLDLLERRKAELFRLSYTIMAAKGEEVNKVLQEKIDLYQAEIDKIKKQLNENKS